MNFAGKVLLVDDEVHIRKFVGLVLKRFCQPTIIEAGDGLVALELFGRENPDLVLLDVNMPNLDGLQTLERLMQVAPDANVIMLTSLANRQTVEDCLRLGALGYIRKDTPKDELGAQLESIMHECLGEDPLPSASQMSP
jgi:two-component system, chemotaxis family, chemotaxis protein CheY